jgi:hypothetical protein
LRFRGGHALPENDKESRMVSRRIAPALSVLALVAGCTNLQAVNTTAGQLVTAASSWDSVAEEFEASCARRNQVSDAASDCSSEKQATAGLEAADQILSAYFTALQQASNGSNFSVDSGISQLSSKVQAIPGVNASQVQAVSSLASFLASVATRALEERTLNLLISDGAPKAQAAIDVMSDVVVRELRRVFERERGQTLTAFSSYIQQSGAAADLRQIDCSSALLTHDFPTGTAYLLAQAYCSKIALLSTKISALDNYKNSLATAKAALQDLRSGKDNLGAKAIAQQLISAASSLKNDIGKINKAF